MSPRKSSTGLDPKDTSDSPAPGSGARRAAVRLGWLTAVLTALGWLMRFLASRESRRSRSARRRSRRRSGRFGRRR
jgi:hypothetical protein